jgi:phospholipid/cholesterol/gamma-HCH transport system substrate-binding protein
MASPRGNPLVIGAFVVGGAVLAALAAILFGSGRLFQTRTLFVAYFDSSVEGLDVGAPVIFRGVQVGDVTSIGAIIDESTFRVAVPVYFELVRGSVELRGDALSGVAGIKRLVEKAGLRAQLKTQSLITGKLYVALDFHPDKPGSYKHLDPEVAEIPTIPTTLEEATAQLRGLLERVEKMPIEQLVSSLASAAAGADALLNKPELAQAVDRLDATLGETQKLVSTLDVRVAGLADRADAAAEKIRAAAASLDAVVAPGSPLQYQLMATLGELEQAARSFRQLSDDLSRQPQSLVFGKPEEGGKK